MHPLAHEDSIRGSEVLRPLHQPGHPAGVYGIGYAAAPLEAGADDGSVGDGQEGLYVGLIHAAAHQDGGLRHGSPNGGDVLQRSGLAGGRSRDDHGVRQAPLHRRLGGQAQVLGGPGGRRV